MKLIKTLCAIGVVAASVNAGNVMAKVSPEEAAKLGKELTPVGAEKAGNAEGTIPEWTGGIIKAPASYVVGQPYPDPYPEDKVKFVISKDNMAQYADKLTDGQKRMLTLYSDYQINVYPTRRSVSYSDKIAAFAKENALNAEMIDNGNGLKNVKGLVPFAIPKQPIELLWNHIMRNRGGHFNRVSVQVTPTENGSFAPVRFYEEFSRRFELKDFAKSKDENVFFYFKQMVTAPARLAGNVLLVHETIDQVREPRRAWIYNSGQRRVRRAPQVGYDGPGTASDGLRTADNFDGYNGAPDRYNWTLDGKQELYIPYNTYKFDDKNLKYKDVVLAGHLNTDYIRSELRRVWKVTGTLKSDKRHIYSKRVFYIEEDSWAIIASDYYDGRGELWRYQEALSKFFYDVGAPFTTIETVHDLLSKRYISSGLANEEAVRYDFTKRFKAKDFTPAALRRSGKR